MPSLRRARDSAERRAGELAITGAGAGRARLGRGQPDHDWSRANIGRGCVEVKGEK